MATSQPYTVASNGGLVKSSNVIDLLKTPGVAKDLRNFEVSTEGGYRRINGYAKFGTTNATRPTGSATNILGTFTYADGVIVTASTGIFFSNDGQNWLNIGRASVAGSGDNHTAFTGRSTLTRTGQGQCQFTLFDGATFDYGQVIISDGANSKELQRYFLNGGSPKLQELVRNAAQGQQDVAQLEQVINLAEISQLAKQE